MNQLFACFWIPATTQHSRTQLDTVKQTCVLTVPAIWGYLFFLLMPLNLIFFFAASASQSLQHQPSQRIAWTAHHVLNPMPEKSHVPIHTNIPLDRYYYILYIKNTNINIDISYLTFWGVLKTIPYQNRGFMAWGLPSQVGHRTMVWALPAQSRAWTQGEIPGEGTPLSILLGYKGVFFLAAEIFLVPAPCTVLSKLDRLVVWHHGSTIDHGTVPNEFWHYMICLFSITTNPVPMTLQAVMEKCRKGPRKRTLVYIYMYIYIYVYIYIHT